MLKVITRKRKGERGQAAVEMALALPFLIWLVFYMINAFHTIHTAHIGQKYAAMSLWERIAYRSKFVCDDVGSGTPVFHHKEFMAVQYENDANSPGAGKPPQRKIIFGPSTVHSVVGICREPGC